MLDQLFKVLCSLIPPRPASNEEAIYRWRIAVAVSVGGLNIMTFGFIAYAFGVFAFLGATGFVRADDLTIIRQQQSQLSAKIVNRLDSIEQNQLTNKADAASKDVINFTEKYCHAQNDETKRLYLGQQHEALSRWFLATNGQPYDVPRCAELVTGTP